MGSHDAWQPLILLVLIQWYYNFIMTQWSYENCQTGPFARVRLEPQHNLPQKVLFSRQAEQLRGEKQACQIRESPWMLVLTNMPGVLYKGLFGLLSCCLQHPAACQIIGQTCCYAFQPSRILAREGRGSGTRENWKASNIPMFRYGSTWSRGEQIQRWHCAVLRLGYPCHSVSAHLITFGSKR